MGEVGARQEREPRLKHPDFQAVCTVVEELRISGSRSGLCKRSFSLEAVPTAKQLAASIDAAAKP